MAGKEPWFSRRETAGDLENRVFNSTSRCNYLDENGEDMRYKQPGLRWGMLSEMRRSTHSEYAGRIQSIFDEVYAKITRLGRERSESPVPVLPTLRTPGISKSRSRLAAKHDSPVDVEFEDNKQSAEVPSDVEKVKQMMENPVVVHDITNTSVRRSLRVKRNDIKSEARFLRENVKSPQINPLQLEVVQEDDEGDQVRVQPPASARPRRSTRPLKSKAAANPVRRATRAATRKSAKAAAKKIRESLGDKNNVVTASVSPGEKERVSKSLKTNVEKNAKKATKEMQKESVTSDYDMDTGSCSPEIEKGTLIEKTPESKETYSKSESNEEKKRESLTLKKMSHCRVSLSKVPSPHPPTPTTHASEGNEQKTQQSKENELSEDPIPIKEETVPLTSEVDGEEEGEEMSAPPTMSPSVKPKRKRKQGKGGRKGAGRGRQKKAAARKNTPVPIEEEEEGTAPSEAMEVDKISTLGQALSAVASNESLYESCTSQVDPSSPVPTAQHSSPSTKTSPSLPESSSPIDHVTDVDGIPLHQDEVSATVVKKPTNKSPSQSALPSQQNQDSASPLTWDTPPSQPTNHVGAREEDDVMEVGETFVKKGNKERALAGTHIKEIPTLTIGGTPLTVKDTPSCPLDATYRISPLSAPYLSESHTPRTLLRLQEEIRVRTKANLVSLAELRNVSPLFTKMTAKKKPKEANPLTLVKNGPSTGRSPSKIPRLAPSGIKRLRSVSLDKVSCQDMTQFKRKSKECGLAADRVVVNSPDTPQFNHAGLSSCSSGSDNDSTPVAPTTEEGSSQEEEEDILNIYLSTPELDSQEEYVNMEEGVCPDSHEKNFTGSKSTGKGPKNFLRSFFDKKNDGKGELMKMDQASTLTSLIPARNSPRKMETRKLRQEKLVEKIQRKREEEERRCEELKAKKQQELQEKRKKREEKAKKVAEKQAALKKQELEKKKRLEGQQSKEEQVKKLNQKKAREQEERQRRQREKMQAVEFKRKEEEDAAKRRAIQIDEERRIMSEMASKRKEVEEEEKRQKRFEKQKLEKERQLQWKAEMEKEQKRKQRELEEAAERRQAEVITNKKPATNGGRAGKERGSGNAVMKKGGDDPKKRLEELLVGAIKVKAPAPLVGSAVPVRQGGSSDDEVTACPNRFLQQWYGMMNSSAKPTSATAKTVKKTTNAPSVTVEQTKPLKESSNTKASSSSDEDQQKDSASALNSTFTKDDTDGAGDTENLPPSSKATSGQGVATANSFTPTHNGHYHLLPGSTLAATLAAKATQQSYAMTPAESDPLHSYENYDIGNLSSDDSTDDDECPKKTIPPWANPQALASFMFDQEAAMEANCIDINKIFPPEQLLKDIDLARIFRLKRKRFFERSSSAHWNSPLYKKNRLEQK